MLTLDHHRWLRNRAAQAHPWEVCGFIMRSGSIIEIANVATDPKNYFSMDLRQISRKVNLRKVFAIWHTHPGGDIRPSRKDLEAIRLTDWAYLIATADEVAWYER